jgi:hypothetical protein
LPVNFTAVTGNQESVLSKVDDFLFNLYSALDGPHQQYEASLRGENLPVDTHSVQDIRFGTITGNGNLTPPFSAPDRFAVGDPRAIAQQANSAEAQLTNTWQQFGDNLQKTAQKTALQTKISNERSSLNALLNQRQALQPSDPGLAALNQKIATLQQNIADDQTHLDQIG